MKQRKLIRPDVLHAIRKKIAMQVPVAKAIAQHNIENDITRPTVVMLVDTLDSAEREQDLKTQELIYDSIMPPWLMLAGEAVQEQPYEYKYVGKFPLGRWECEI